MLITITQVIINIINIIDKIFKILEEITICFITSE